MGCVPVYRRFVVYLWGLRRVGKRQSVCVDLFGVLYCVYGDILFDEKERRENHFIDFIHLYILREESEANECKEKQSRKK